jgi:hypothetical protein
VEGAPHARNQNPQLIFALSVVDIEEDSQIQ